jgi:hypothetical protein
MHRHLGFAASQRSESKTVVAPSAMKQRAEGSVNQSLVSSCMAS